MADGVTSATYLEKFIDGASSFAHRVTLERRRGGE
jgi:hypothetical protein